VSNRLTDASSPYLRQHRNNPVDWFPWGDEAFAEARRTGRPILLSVGYSACHWCHVMAHESFEDHATAEVMNELFINIKVDELTQGKPFRHIDDVISQAELRQISDDYKKIAGFSLDAMTTKIG
jgi:thioredoxin-related protein